MKIDFLPWLLCGALACDLATGSAAQAQAQAQDAQTAAAPAQAQPQVQPDEAAFSADRPGFSTPTGIVPLGHIQLEGGATASRTGDARGYSFGELLVRVPASKRVEVRVGVPSYLVMREKGQRSAGADDSFVETKIRLASGKKATYALLLNAVLPTGSRRVAEHRLQPGVNLAADLTLSRTVGVTLNLSAVDASSGGQRFGQVAAISSFNFTLSPKTGAFAELYAASQHDGPAQKYADGGFTYLLSPRTQIDASAGVGLGNKAGGPDYFYGLGLARLF